MDFLEQSNSARINSDLRAEIVRLKESVIQIRKNQLIEGDLSAALISRQYFEIQKLRKALERIEDEVEEDGIAKIAERALKEES